MLKSIVSTCVLMAISSAHTQAGPDEPLTLRPLATTASERARLYLPALSVIEPARGSGVPYVFARLTESGAAEVLATPPQAEPLLTLNGDLAGVRVRGADRDSIQAWDEKGVVRWTAVVPANRIVHVLPAAGYFTVSGGVEGCTQSIAQLQFYSPDGGLIGTFDQPDRVIWAITCGPTGLVAFIMGEANGQADSEVVLLSPTGAVLARRPLNGSAGRFRFVGLEAGPAGAAAVVMVVEEGIARPTLVVLKANGAVQAQRVAADVGGYPTWADSTHVALLGSETVAVWDAAGGCWDGRVLTFPGFVLAGQARLLGRELVALTHRDGRVTLSARSLDDGLVRLERPLPEVRPEVGRSLMRRTDRGVVVIAGTNRLLIAKEEVRP